MVQSILVALAFALAASSTTTPSPGPNEICPLSPSGWSVKQTRGPDFDVCYYTCPEKKGFFGIYLGFAPQFQKQAGAGGIPGSVGGIAVQWLAKKPETGVLPFAQETILSPFAGDENAERFKAHAWVYAESEADLGEMRDAIAQVRWRPHGKWHPNLPYQR